MYWESALESAIEVAIAIAGFSGIVAAVGQRANGHWSEADHLRLRILLTASGAALIFGFLPFLVIAWVDPPQLWQVASGLLALYFIGITAHRARQAFAGGIAAEVGVGPGRLTLQVAIVTTLVANTFWFASATLYVLGVLWCLLIAFMTFATLLLESWRQPPAASPPDALQ